MIVKNVLELIGNTPVVKLNNVVNKNGAEVYVKLEKFNVGGSVKDRAVMGMLMDAKENGNLKDGDIIVEPTSGNTGIAIAMIGNLMGHKVVITMPETMSFERRDILKAYGAEIVLTPGDKGMKGAIEKAEEIAEKDNYYMPMQFSNQSNADYHYKTTAKEIIEDFEKLDYFVAGVGTGGTISGTGKRLKEYYDDIKVIAVEPSASSVLSGGGPGPHKIQGIGAGFVPNIYDKSVVDSVLTISNEESFEFTRTLALKEGLFLGISSGAAIKVAVDMASTLNSNQKVLVIAPDGGEKYLTSKVF